MKTKMLVTTLVLAASTSAFAQGFQGTENNASGFNGPTQGITTVQQVFDAGTFSDDMPVTLTGNIKSSLGDEMFIFTDSTGEITIEIDNDKWLNQTATPENQVQIVGEIDKDISGTKIDVDVIRVL
ncbi:MAG TPA: hypothetical protein DCS35_00500 [Vibrio sp.]|nr:hypothetical protein [Vibrio sp.]